MLKLNNFVFLCFLIIVPYFAWSLEKLSIKVVSVYPHDTKNFTQGLISDGDAIYESVGQYNQSKLKWTHLQTGATIKETHLPKENFAEGIAAVGDYLIQLTWDEQKALFYKRDTLAFSHSLPYKGQGWGLCDDQGTLWMSNGSAKLVQRDAKTFKILNKITVKLNGRPVPELNDLICVGDVLYANVWKKDYILRIDKKSGQVTGMIDAKGLLTEAERKQLGYEHVLNGIAYRPETGTFLITGKCWPHLFEVEFLKEKV